MAFPASRLRRLRRTETLRTLVRETRLTPEAFVYPLFICPGTGIRKEVRSMPGVFNLSVDEAVREEPEDLHGRLVKDERTWLRRNRGGPRTAGQLDVRDADIARSDLDRRHWRK